VAAVVWLAVAGGCGRDSRQKGAENIVRKHAVRLEKIRTVDPRNLAENDMIFDEFARESGGGLFLLDGKNVRIVKIDAAGKQVAAFLKKGEGPGEFGPYPKMQLLDGRLWVIGRKKIGRFTLAGKLEEEYPLKLFYGSIRLVDDTHFLATHIDYGDNTKKASQFTKYVGLFSLPSETLEYKYREAPNLGRMLVDLGNKRMMSVIPGPEIMADFVFAFDGQNREILLSKTDDYRIQILALDGTPGSLISIPHTPQPLTAEGKKAVADKFGNISDDIKQIIQKELPDTLPALQEIQWLDNGHILVKRVSGLYTSEMDILDKTGKYLFTLELPLKPGTTRYTIDHGLLLAIEEEDDRNIYAEYKITGLPTHFQTPR